jgi:hypothetical protein
MLTARDHQLLNWPSDHGVLTTPQISAALFPSLDFTQRRLSRLTTIGVVDRFRPLKLDGGSLPYHYVLDQLGAEVARTHPGTALSEPRCQEIGAFAETNDPPDLKALQPPIHPDGHGI